MSYEMREAADESADAYAFVVFADEPAHAVHALDEPRPPLAELGGRGVALRQTLDHGIGRQRTGLEREQHPGGVQRIEEPKRVAHQHPAVAGDLARAIRVFLGGP